MDINTQIINYLNNNTNILLDACKNNNIELVKLLLDHPDFDINKEFEVKDSNNNTYTQTVLIEAVMNKNIEIIQLLLQQKNIDINKKACYGSSALIVAVGQNNFEIIQLLLQHKDIDINIKFRHGVTPLMMTNSHKIFQFLLSQPDIMVNIQDEDGNTALLHKCIKYDERYDSSVLYLIKILLDHPEIDFNIKNNKDKNIIDYSNENTGLLCYFIDEYKKKHNI